MNNIFLKSAFANKQQRDVNNVFGIDQKTIDHNLYPFSTDRLECWTQCWRAKSNCYKILSFGDCVYKFRI